MKDKKQIKEKKNQIKKQIRKVTKMDRPKSLSWLYGYLEGIGWVEHG
ncbi:MAG: hypothetical protein ACOCUD_01700 [Bacillota bacterium]